jgi:peroxiredoxin
MPQGSVKRKQKGLSLVWIENPSAFVMLCSLRHTPYTKYKEYFEYVIHLGISTLVDFYMVTLVVFPSYSDMFRQFARDILLLPHVDRKLG